MHGLFGLIKNDITITKNDIMDPDSPYYSTRHTKIVNLFDKNMKMKN